MRGDRIMDCAEARTLLLDRQRDRLDPRLAAALDEHLAGCEACRHEDAADRELSARLQALPRRRAPAALRRALEEQWGEAPKPRRWAGGGRFVAAMAAGAALAVLVGVGVRARSQDDRMVTEAVNDYLRVLYEAHPIEIESGGIHQVKPWFEGRVDFAPVVEFGGDDDFPLLGGSVAYFVDRKAAAFQFKRRLHPITLFVFRAEGLAWPSVGERAIGAARGVVETQRGFHVALWRQGDLGYALVSDVNEADLMTLAARIAHP
jgi:anti-sigma factor RsiW